MAGFNSTSGSVDFSANTVAACVAVSVVAVFESSSFFEQPVSRQAARAKGQETKVGPPKSATSVRDVPLNDTAIEMINRLREEVYLGEDSPLIPNEKGNFIKPINLLRRFYRLQAAAGIPEEDLKGLHALRHTFATTLINGIKQPDGTIKSLTVKQVADLLGHTTTEITELYYVKKDNTKLEGLTDAFNL